ncbi:WD-repeat domain-containing protein [Theileria equi strain WA]|uniref:WD-repeat domain-containing protein n=1 Tax=Theileria equi strain WA TaxID=1537102 RepID=L0B1J3_THEEQ|nr:WD-repeat domain-containing protein [Theileria equi strain WA]AFZ81121.1 WD-repeat domain-containing protein [Theileria equi strain WA]|eukprot:XP_004830787.1 WD-repeat domain-containing protein [Theileria equi strain WA]
MGIDTITEECVEVWNGFSKSQLLRIVMQLLYDLGYRKTLEILQEESLCLYHIPEVQQLEKQILFGDIFEAKLLLKKLNLQGNILEACKFLSSQQLFLEFLYNGDAENALKILRDHLAPEAFDSDSIERVHQCSTLLVLPSSYIVSEGLDLKFESSREALWNHIQFLISPELTIPPNRLLTLIRQACELQELHCKSHLETISGEQTVPSLLVDHRCKAWNLPSECISRLEKHTDEIWDISISPNGLYFATASKDESVILWSAKSPFNLIHHWKAHQSIVSCLAWSSDGKFLVSCGNDGLIILWSPGSDESVLKFEPHSAVATSVAWVPNTWKFLSSGMDKYLMLHEIEQITREDLKDSEITDCMNFGLHKDKGISEGKCTYKGKTLHKWSFESRIRALTINKDGTLAIFATIDRVLRVWNLIEMKETTSIPESAAITTLTCSKLFNQVLVSVAGNSPVMRLWDIDEKRIVQTYRGHREDRYVLRSAFGGPSESFIVSGSEDAQIYIWNKIFGTLLSVIAAHSSTVNAVAWSPEYLFSVSDDKTIAVWVPTYKNT